MPSFSRMYVKKTEPKVKLRSSPRPSSPSLTSISTRAVVGDYREHRPGREQRDGPTRQDRRERTQSAININLAIHDDGVNPPRFIIAPPSSDGPTGRRQAGAIPPAERLEQRGRLLSDRLSMRDVEAALQYALSSIEVQSPSPSVPSGGYKYADGEDSGDYFDDDDSYAQDYRGVSQSPNHSLRSFGSSRQDDLDYSAPSQQNTTNLKPDTYQCSAQTPEMSRHSSRDGYGVHATDRGDYCTRYRDAGAQTGEATVYHDRRDERAASPTSTRGCDAPRRSRLLYSRPHRVVSGSPEEYFYPEQHTAAAATTSRSSDSSRRASPRSTVFHVSSLYQPTYRVQTTAEYDAYDNRERRSARGEREERRGSRSADRGSPKRDTADRAHGHHHHKAHSGRKRTEYVYGDGAGDRHYSYRRVYRQHK